MRLLLLPLAVLVVAQPAPDTGTQVYSKVVRSTVWIHSRHGQSQASGSGSLSKAGVSNTVIKYMQKKGR